MSEERTIEEIAAEFYSVALKIFVADMRREDRSLTEQQATARFFREHPEAYEAMQRPRARKAS